MKVNVVHEINALYSITSEIKQYLFEEFRPLIITNDLPLYHPLSNTIHTFVHFKKYAFGCVNDD